MVGDQILDALNNLKKTLGGERISWVEQERFHITLRFLGKTKVSSIEKIGETLKKNVSVREAFHVSVTGPGSYGPRKKPRVIWLGFSNSAPVDSLKQEVDQALHSIGIVFPDQPFSAHLTLGRVRNLKDTKIFYETLGNLKNQFEGQILINRVVFYRSILGGGGPEYIPLEGLDFTEGTGTGGNQPL